MVNEKYMEYLTYVKEYLTRNHGIVSPNPKHPFRSRFQHTIRVLHWCFRLADDMEKIDPEVLYTAAIFHDIGYADHENDHHALRSGRAFHEYAKAHNMEENFRNRVERLIYAHSNKELLKRSDTELELVLLLEADLLDEEGAMGVVWDCMTMGNVHASSYAAAYDHIMKNSNKEEENPMVTEKAKAFWEEKKQVAAKFAELLAKDLMIGSPYFDL
ncbi:MAG: HD domain-containing protein [Lachnospiraceae bacterium]|nr:HD domain-containing protein [Lachnospiraceae bacterium]